MSRREYPVAERYEERESDFYRRPRRERDYDELDVDITRAPYPDDTRSRGARTETVVKQRDTAVDDRRSERGPRQPDFLRDDYGQTSAGPLVVRPSRGPERVDEEKVTIRERSRSRGPPSRPRTDYAEKDEIIYRDQVRDRTRSRPPPPRERSDEDLEIKIKRKEESRPPPPRTEYKEKDVDEIRFRRGGGDRPAPARSEVDKEEIRFVERRSPPPRSDYRGRETVVKEDEIDIRERSVPARSASRPALVARDREEWIVRHRKEPSPPPPPRDYEKEEIIIRRKERSPSPEPPPPPPPARTYEKEEVIIRRKERSPSPPPPPPRDIEKEQIIIRRRERTPSPEPPPREPTPEPPPPPIVRPPIIQEVITHHRHIDHGVERARSPTPPPPPPPPAASPPREDDIEIQIRRQGTRNGKFYDEDIILEKDMVERKNRDEVREVSRQRSLSTRRRSPSPRRRVYEDDVAAEAEYYNRRVSDRAYPGEAWNGATKDWSLVDVPPGTERVRMDGIGGGRQEISWERYSGERRAKFYTGDRVYEQPFGNGLPEAPPPPAPIEAPPPPADTVKETRITERRITEETSRGKTKERMWTEITKDLVIKEAVEESGYDYEETDDFFYVMEYLRYEDVLRLVELTEDIRRERRERLREIQWEREELERIPKMLPAPPSAAPPRREYDREYIYERDRYRR